MGEAVSEGLDSSKIHYLIHHTTGRAGQISLGAYAQKQVSYGNIMTIVHRKTCDCNMMLNVLYRKNIFKKTKYMKIFKSVFKDVFATFFKDVFAAS